MMLNSVSHDPTHVHHPPIGVHVAHPHLPSEHHSNTTMSSSNTSSFIGSQSFTSPNSSFTASGNTSLVGTTTGINIGLPSLSNSIPPSQQTSTPTPTSGSQTPASSNFPYHASSGNNDSTVSLFYQCQLVLGRLQGIPSLVQYVKLSYMFSGPDDPMSQGVGTSLNIVDPVATLWNTFRLGEPLCQIYNLLNPSDPISTTPSASKSSSANSKMSTINTRKAQVFHFITALRAKLKFREDEVFTISDLFYDDTNGFVKVIRTVALLLDRLQQKGYITQPVGQNGSQQFHPQDKGTVSSSSSATLTALDDQVHKDRTQGSPTLAGANPPSMPSTRRSSLRNSLTPSDPETLDHDSHHMGNDTEVLQGGPRRGSGDPIRDNRSTTHSSSGFEQFANMSLSDANSSTILSNPPVPAASATEGKPSLRSKVVIEFLTTERAYFSSLETLQKYMQYLSSHDILSPQLIHQLFANLNALVDFQRRFLVGVEAVVQGAARVGEERLGFVFTKMEEGFKVYEPFCANYKTACEIAQQEAPTLMRAAEIVEPTFGLPSLLIKPVQRVCKYPLLLQELIKQTDRETYPFFDELVRGHQAMLRVADKVNETSRKVENVMVKEDLERRVEDWKNHDPTHFGPLLLSDKFTMAINDEERSLHIFLFEKIILCCKETYANSISLGIRKKKKDSIRDKPGFEIKGRIWMGSVQGVIPEKKGNTAFALKVFWKSVEMESFTLKCQNEEQQRLWQATLEQCVDSIAEKKKRSRAHAQAQAQAAAQAQQQQHYHHSNNAIAPMPERGYSNSSIRSQSTATAASLASLAGAHSMSVSEPLLNSKEIGLQRSMTPQQYTSARSTNGHIPVGQPASLRVVRHTTVAHATSRIVSSFDQNGDIDDAEDMSFGDRPQDHMQVLQQHGYQNHYQIPIQHQHGHHNHSTPDEVNAPTEQALAARRGTHATITTFPSSHQHHPLQMHPNQQIHAPNSAGAGGQAGYQQQGSTVIYSANTNEAPRNANRTSAPASPSLRGRSANVPLDYPDGSKGHHAPHVAQAAAKGRASPSLGSAKVTPAPTNRATMGNQSGMASPGGAAGEKPPQSINVKTHYRSDVYVIKVPRNISYSSLVEKVIKKIRLCGPQNVAENAPPSQPQQRPTPKPGPKADNLSSMTDLGKMRIKYQDEDGDKIIIKSDDDVQMAFETALERGGDGSGLNRAQVYLFVTLA